jgi:hypothetical protein
MSGVALSGSRCHAEDGSGDPKQCGASAAIL